MDKHFEEAIRAAFRAGVWHAMSKLLPDKLSGTADDEDTYIRKLKEQPITVRFTS